MNNRGYTENGFIKLHRSLLKWEWYDDPKTKILFIHLLLTVNYKDMAWQGKRIRRGSRATSYAELSKETGLSVREIRTGLKHLESTGEVTRSTFPKYTVITIKNYGRFQQVTSKTTEETTSNVTSKRQAPYIYKKDKNIYKKEKRTSDTAPGREPPGQLSGGTIHLDEGGDF